MEFALILFVVAGAVLLVTGPLRESSRAHDESLEAELAELDYKTGKLSDHDWRTLDRTLRAEAVELLKRLDRVQERAESLP